MSKYFVWFLAIIVFEYFVFIGIGRAEDQAKQFWWSNISYQYGTEREFVTLTPEFETNDLPFDLELYGFVDFTGDHGHDETNLKNHCGSFDLFKPLNTFGIAEDNIVLHMFDVAIEYNIGTFTDDRCYFGFRWRGTRTFGGISKFLNRIHATFDTTVFLARTDGRQGHNWWMISPHLKIPFSIGRVKCFSSTWCDIDFDNPLNEYRNDSVSGQSMLGVNIWKQLYAFCEVKYEDFQEPFDDAFGIGFGLMWQCYFEKPESATRR
ncbi:MAG: hypothetical protein QM498_01300 [Desulfobacterium sp.]